MISLARLIYFFTAAAIMVFPSSCSVPVTIQSATAEPTEGSASSLITLTLTRGGLKKIYQNEIHFSIKVVACDGTKQIYVAIPKLNGALLDDFNALRNYIESTSRNTYEITAVIDGVTVNELKKYCTRLDGGSYFLQKLSVAPVPLMIKSGTNLGAPRQFRGHHNFGDTILIDAISASAAAFRGHRISGTPHFGDTTAFRGHNT